MSEISELISGLLKELKLPYRLVAIIVFVLLGILGIIAYENATGTFYLGRLEKQVSILSELNDLSSNGVTTETYLNPIYEKLATELNEYGQSKSNAPWPIYSTSDPAIIFWKAFSGSFIWIILLISGIFVELSKPIRSIKSFFSTITAILLIALLFGWIGIIIPIIISPIINYLGFPIIQILLLVLLFRKSIKPKEVS